MEPSSLTPPPDDTRLDDLLRQAPPPLPDDGFSQRVIASLPPHSQAIASRRRLIFVTIAALTGYLIAFPHLNPWPSLIPLFAEFDHAIMAPFSDPYLGLPFAVAALAIFFAFFSNETENSRFQ